MTDASPHSEQWRDYRSRRLWFFSVWAGGFLVLAMLMFGVPVLFGGSELWNAVQSWIFVIGGLGWMLGWCVMAIRWKRFPCPRCSKQFSSSIWWPLLGKCAHCGLRRGE